MSEIGKAADRLESILDEKDRRIEALERELAEAQDMKTEYAAQASKLLADKDALASQLAEARAENERKDGYFTRIIQVRGGAGMLQGTEALDEVARLAGQALSESDHEG